MRPDTFSSSMTASAAPRILLVNPWIHDFAAYDVWSAPLGLLALGGILRDHGADVVFIDCLDRFHPQIARKPAPDRRHGRGPYLKTPIPKPPGLSDIPRTWCRYGILPEWLHYDLSVMKPPDLVLVTSLMTYWYPGVRETIDVIRSVFPNVPVVLGGIYATLCTDHADTCCGADHVVAGPGEEVLLPLVARLTHWSPDFRYNAENRNTLPRPALDLCRYLAHVPLLTTQGCPFHCAYCASRYLQPRFLRQDPKQAADEIQYWYKAHGVRDFAFYDDALLVDADSHIIPILEAVISSGITVRFHTPNALHIRYITRRLADLMFRSGFHTLRLGLETTSAESRQSMDAKVEQEEFFRAVHYLKEAGFRSDQVGAYLLAGLPGQSDDTVESAILTVKSAGITPIIAHYTPIPHTALWPLAVSASRYDLATDPIFTNNAIFPCHPDGFSWDRLTRFKQLIQG
ncbi:radical SAM protein [Desulfosarcina sp. OttesenSCG-928-A07]|nr:radical SAM protein [Desulfosarcina sp. OttesenSCG-928-G17]MDL2330126.1 radical SAM protein [Desulfosarcina sp. OttesenSCG-928-A07]